MVPLSLTNSSCSSNFAHQGDRMYPSAKQSTRQISEFFTTSIIIMFSKTPVNRDHTARTTTTPRKKQSSVYKVIFPAPNDL